MIMQTMEIAIYDMAINMLQFIPTFSLPADATNAINNALQIVGGFNSIFPVGDLVACLIIAVGFKSFGLILYGINWLIRKIPTVS